MGHLEVGLGDGEVGVEEEVEVEGAGGGGDGAGAAGEELGGERGLAFYMQRTALQGDRAVLDRITSGDAPQAG